MIPIDPYYYVAYPLTGLLMIILGRAFVFFVKNNLPFPDHQPRPIFEELSFGIFACGAIQYLSGAIYHGSLFYEVYALLWVLNSAGLFFVALTFGGVGAVYSMRRGGKTVEQAKMMTGPEIAKIISSSQKGLHGAASTVKDVDTIYKIGKVALIEAAGILRRNGEGK